MDRWHNTHQLHINANNDQKSQGHASLETSVTSLNSMSMSIMHKEGQEFNMLLNEMCIMRSAGCAS